MLRRRIFSPWSDSHKLTKVYGKLEEMLQVPADRVALCM